MMNKLIKLLLLQCFFVSGFLVSAKDNSIAVPTQLKINNEATSEVIGRNDKGILISISGCPVGSDPMWYWKQEYLNGTKTGDELMGSGLTPDPEADPLGNSYFSQPLGGEGGNARKSVEYSYKCEDPLNPGTPLSTHLEARIKIFIQRSDNATYRYPTANPAWQEGEYTQCKDGQDLIVKFTTTGCPTGDVFWVHPNSALNLASVGTDKYWESSNKTTKDVSGGNVSPGATYVAKCKVQYYNAATHATVTELTRGVDVSIPNKFVVPAPLPNKSITYARFVSDPNLVSADLCPGETIDITHGIFNGNYDAKLQGYSWAWGIDNGGAGSGFVKEFDGKKTIQASAQGRYYLFLNNEIPACATTYHFAQGISTNREIESIAIQKPIIAGNSQVCPDGANAITVQNVGSLTGLTSYKWYVNDKEVPNQTAVSYNATDKAKTVQASYLSNIKSSLGTFCSAPLSDALTITPYTRPEKPTITKISGSKGYCDYNFPSLDLTLASNNTSLIGDPTYTWKLGNNVIGTNSNQLLGSANSMDGSYTVVITDGNGCNSLPSDDFVIEKFPSPAKPVVSNKNGKDAYCDYNIPFNAITLEATNTSLVGAAKYLWSTGSVNNSADITKEGIYSVTVTDANGCTSPEGKYEITKYTRPAKPSITNKDGKAAYCDYTIPFASVTLEANNTSLEGAPKYNWSNGSNLMTSTVTTEGVYTVTITDANDCISLPGSYEIVKQTRPAKPVITRKTGADAYCDYKFPVSDLSLESSNTSLIGDAIYTWNNVVKSKILPVTTEGNYTVKVTDANGCDSESSEPYTITKWTSPAAPSIAIAGNRVNCALDDTDKQITVAFSVTNASDRFSYEWFNTGSNSVLSKTNALTSVSSNGTYFAIQTDKNGCFSPKSEGIKVSFVPNPNFSGAKISKLGAYGLQSEGLGNWTAPSTAGDFQWKAGTTLNSSVANNIKVSAANNGNGDYSVRRKYAFTVDNTPIVCFSNTVKYTFVADPDFNGVAVYPNPTSGTVKIDLLDEWKNASVVVYDLVGRPVYNGTMDALTATGNSLSIDLSSLGSGIYILNIKSSNGDKSYQGKILVNK
jgi:hypothetical protein